MANIEDCPGFETFGADVKPGQSQGKSYAEWDAQRKRYWRPAKAERRKCSYKWIFDCG